MRSVSRLAVFTAALLVGAATVVASEESVRSMRVVEKPEDLATVFADAQTAVTYDSMSGRFYYPSLGLYFDPVTSLFFDPSTGLYRNHVLQGEYTEDSMTGMYYDAVTGLYFDPEKQMTFNSATSLYHDLESGLDLSWDDSLRMFYDPVAGSYYDRGLGTHLIYDQMMGMFYNAEVEAYYDPELGLYYDEQSGLFFDPIVGRYYDKATGEYIDPSRGKTIDDVERLFYYDPTVDAYYNGKDQRWYDYDCMIGLYVAQIPRTDMETPIRIGARYYDPNMGFHIANDGKMGNFLVEETGDTFDVNTGYYYDSFKETYYRYDTMALNLVEAESGMDYIPHWMEVGSYRWRMGDVSNMTYDSMMGMYYDSYTGMYYDADDDMYYDGMNYYRSPYGDSYWYDQMWGCYVNSVTGEQYEPPQQQGARSVDVSNMYYDTMMEMYYDYSSMLYYDAVDGMYYDGMHYYRQPQGDSYWYDPMGMCYVNSMTGECFTPSQSTVADATDSSDMFYDPTVGLYYDYSTMLYYDANYDMYYDRSNDTYYDKKNDCWYYYDSATGLYFDQEPNYDMGMSMGMDSCSYYYDPITEFHFTYNGWSYSVEETGDVYDPWSRCFYDVYYGNYYYYDDSMSGDFVDAMTFSPYTPHWLENHSYDWDPVSPDLNFDTTMRMYYDRSTGLYFDARDIMYFDGMLYYRQPYGESYWYDSMEDCYYNCATGERYTPSRSHGNNTPDLANMYYDSMMGMCYDPLVGYWYEDEVGLYYDGWFNYYDPQTWESYWYDSMMNQYYNNMTGAAWTPRSYSSNGGSNGVDTSNMSWDSMYGMFYDMATDCYYDDTVGLYYDGWYNYYDPQTWESYWYDSMMNQYYNNMTGAAWTPRSSSSNGGSDGVDMSNMFWDSMYGMYYDMRTDYYYDDKVGLYYDGMCCYYDPQTWRCYYYDSMQDFYYDPMTGERYEPRKKTTGLTQEEIAEIKRQFILLGEANPYASEVNEYDMMVGTGGVLLENDYYVAPFGAADAVWFDNLFNQGMDTSARRVRLRASAMPLQIEVDIESRDMYGYYVPTGLFVEVPEEVWNRATKYVVLTLLPAWSSMMGANVMLWNGNSMTYWTMTATMGVEGVDSVADFAAYAQYAGNSYYEDLFSNAIFRGCWSFDCSGMGMMGDTGLSPSCTRTVSGLLDTDGDGLADVDEYVHGTNPFMSDTDGDGMNDALELRIGSNPTMYDEDSDYDGMADVWEEHFGLNPQNPVDANADPDHDGLNNQREYWLGTNPIEGDTDGDGLRDGDELKHGTNPCNPDTDNDQLPDAVEIARGTNPCNPDTDSDGVQDGAEIGAGLSPLNVDTDDYGVSDRDMLKYDLQNGMGKDDVANRLKTWLPLEVDVVSDSDGDGWLDYVEDMVGSSPHDGADTPERIDGVPQAFELVVTLHQELPHAILLEVDGAQVCLRKPCTVRRWMAEGVVHTLKLIGRQGMQTPISVSFGSSKVKVVDPDGILQGGSQPSSACSNDSTERKAEFYQLGVAFSPDHICFHGSQTVKSVACRMVPDDDAMIRPVWVLGDPWGEVLNCLQDDLVNGVSELGRFEGEYTVNIPRELAGYTLYCLFLDYNNEVVCVGECDIESCWRNSDDHDDGWCITHKCEHGFCACDNMDASLDTWCNLHGCHVVNCPIREEHTDTVNIWPVSDAKNLGEFVYALSSDPVREDGEPYFTKNAWRSVAYNDDDDDGNGKNDLDDQILDSDQGQPLDEIEDNFREFSPFPFDRRCCHCPEHEGLATAKVIGPCDKLGIFTSTAKDKMGADPWPTHLFAEGRVLSSKPCDAKLIWELNVTDEGRTVVTDEDRTIVTNEFSVYSVRLIPDLDLDKDRVVNADDEKLVKEMKRLKNLGLCLNPGSSRKIKLKCDVLMPGTVKLAVVENGNCTVALEDVPEPLLNGTREKGQWSQDFSIRALKKNQPSEDAYAIVEATYTGSGSAKDYECKARLRITVLDFQIAGDGNRDGKIDFNNPADTNIVFWVNDDYDVIRYNSEMDEHDFQEDDDGALCYVNGQEVHNCDDDVIGMLKGVKGANLASNQGKELSLFEKMETQYCLRDLEDFDRLQFQIDECLLGKDVIAVEMRFVPVPGHDCPSINLFRARLDGNMYLRGITSLPGNFKEDKARIDDALAVQMKETCIARIGAKWQTFKKEYKVESMNRFLYEGSCDGMNGSYGGLGFLEVRVRCGDLVLAQTSLKLQLEEARAFTEIYAIKDTRETIREDMDEFSLSVPRHRRVTPATAQMPGYDGKELVLLVCGWNVSDEEKETWNDTVFKRLFWHGYRGRTGSLFWPCQRDFEGIVDAVTDAEHFDRSEHRAWLSGKTAARQFGKLVADGTHLTLLTHSQGNVLVGEALRQLKKMNPQALGNITYLAWQGAISAQMYTTKYDVTDKTLKNEMASHDFAWLAVAHGNTQKWLQAINLLNPDTSAPDWFGYYPNGRGGYGPYLDGVLNELRYSKNFFNRYDYALNLWLGKQATRPDKLAVCPFGYTMGKVSYLDGDGKRQSFVPTNPRGRFYQNRPEGRMVIYPGDSSEVSGAGYPFYGNERVVKPLAAKDKDGEPFEGGELAKWCTFSFVVNSRSLAIGQVDMDGVFAECTNLEGKYQFTDRHYGHSFEFRSNICYTWWLWEEIIEGIRKNGKQEVKK